MVSMVCISKCMEDKHRYSVDGSSFSVAFDF